LLEELEILLGQKRFSTKESVWNSDRFKDPEKHSVVHEIIRENRLGFFAVIETWRGSFSAPLKKFGGLDYICYPFTTSK
jgi:hypothetical protein